LDDQKHALEEQKQVEARRQFLAQTLSPRTVANTAYDEQGKCPCDSDTRNDLLADIKNWIYDISGNAQNLLWLTGDPGSGKSAVTASVARECKDAGILWAQFFINRNISDTTNPTAYFPSIARQLADRSPDVAQTIHDALKAQPSLLDDISQRQAGKLFVDSLRVASSVDPSKAVVVIVDGLDETDAARLRFTAEVFSNVLVDLPRNVKLFVSSRTEDDIQRPFSVAFEANRVKKVHLDTSSQSSVRDVSTFLVREISEIVERNGLDSVQWPGEERLRGLCSKASGLFIWAVTTAKFIQDQVDIWGSECLDVVLDELNSKGMGDINVLYGTILRLTHKDQTDPWVFERFRRIVGCIVVLQEPLCLADLKALLNLRKTSASMPVDIEHFVRRLRTVLVAGTDAIGGQTIPRLHKSFYEFITSPRADPLFRVDIERSNGETAILCLRQLAGLNGERAATDAPAQVPARIVKGCFPTLYRYASRFWPLHLPAAEGLMAIASPVTLPELQELSRVLGEAGTPHPSSVNIAAFPDRKQMTSSWDNMICLWDVESGALTESPLKGHRHMVSSVAYSPDGKYIVSGSWDCTLRLWDARSGQPIGVPFKGHTGAVLAVAYSPDGTQIVSGSWDCTVQLWDAPSGEPRGKPFVGHTLAVRSVAFSRDGREIVSGSWDHTIRHWGTHDGRCIGLPLKGHTSAVYAVAFSPDGRHIMSGSWDHTVRLWDAKSHRRVGLPLKGHTSTVNSAAFSPSGEQIVSGSWDKSVRLWDVESGQAVGLPFKGHDSAVYCVAFSPDGKRIVSASWDHTLRLWDVASGQPVGLPFNGHTSTVNAVAFSPDGKQLVSASSDCTLRLWDVGSGQPIEFPIAGHTKKVTSIAVSPDGRSIFSASLDDTIRVWNAETGRADGPPFSAGDIKGVSSLALSPDGWRIAAASLDGTVCIWHTEDRRLCASHAVGRVNGLASVTFLPDGQRLKMVSLGGMKSLLDVTSGEIVEDLGVAGPFEGGGRARCFRMETGWCEEEDGDAVLRWIPVDDPDFGLWAYIDGYIVRSDGKGSTSVFDVGRMSRT
jgi:WD40 repeat protein